jgi:diaminopimelate epimerase
MLIHFYKYQGTGNDFIILNGWNSLPQLTYQQIRQLCDRHFGIGADGLMIIRPHQEFDFEMLYYNADGLPGSMCGNGSRCLVSFARRMGYIHNQCTFTAPDGVHEAKIIPDGWISVSMHDVKDATQLANGDYCLNTGSPHYIAWKNPDALDVVSEGKIIRNSDAYVKEGINVNFVAADRNTLRIRTYERGVEDETLSCGTGITAAVIAAVLSGRTDGKQGYTDVESRGGKLRVRFERKEQTFSAIRLEGPAVLTYEGIISI